jgi:exodeoxyribonuclease V alpha subunit
VLADIINAKIPSIPVVRLRRIFRQGAQSQIKEAAHLDNSGLLPRIEYQQDSDFFLRVFQPKDDSEEAKAAYRQAMADELVDLAARSVKRGFDPRRDVQILVPGKRGPLGTEALNKVLQARLNPTPADSIQIGEAIWQTGDRVMQIRNAYKRGPGVFNGDIGFVFSIDREEKILRVRIDEHIVDYSFSDLDELQLAYASTMHKSQGSEFPFVLLAVDWSHFTLLVRNLIYTGMTRAKKLLVMFANPGALRKAVNTEDTAHRYTLLKHWLQETA